MAASQRQNRTKQKKNNSRGQPQAKPTLKPEQTVSPQEIQRALADPGAVRPEAIRQLQRMVGNKELLSRSNSIKGEPKRML